MFCRMLAFFFLQCFLNMGKIKTCPLFNNRLLPDLLFHTGFTASTPPPPCAPLLSGERLGFIVCLTTMQMLKQWNVPQTGADGRDRPLLFTLKEHDITTYGPGDWSVVRERWLRLSGANGEGICAEAKCCRNVFHDRNSQRGRGWMCRRACSLIWVFLRVSRRKLELRWRPSG